jgi:hypothetical protein
MKGNQEMSMTRDAYAKQVMRVAEAALRRNEAVLCPHEDCGERLSIVRQNTFSTRSLFCPIHGHIFKEQELPPYGKLDWESHEHRLTEESSPEWAVEEEDYN